MSRTFLIGDSVRIGYDEYVVQDYQTVSYTAENNNDSANVAANISAWLAAYDPDVVHFNCGLHDVKRDGGAAVPCQVSQADYTTNLNTIFAAINAYGAECIFATTTPVDESQNPLGTIWRFNADIDAYNTIAVARAAAYGATVNDLNTFVTDNGLGWTDGVHYSVADYQTLGAEVSSYIPRGDHMVIGGWDATDCVLAYAPAAWSLGNGTADKNTGNFPSYPDGAYQNCVMTNMNGTTAGYFYNNGNGYLKFNGVNSLIDSTYPLTVSNVSQLTIEIKINWVSTASHQIVCGLLDNADNQTTCTLLSTNTAMIYFEKTGNADYALSTDTLSDGLHTVHFVKDGASLKIYFDGAEVSAYAHQDAFALGTKTYTDKYTVGQKGDNSNPLSSNLSWFALYETALSTTRIATNHALGNNMGLTGFNDGDTMQLSAPAGLFYFFDL